MLIAQKLHRSVEFMRSVPKKYIAIGGGATLVLFYGLTFLLPATVHFSYQGETCRNRLTILPETQKSSDATYDVSFKDTWALGSVQIASMKTCFSPKGAPKEGSRIVGTAPFDGFFARSLYNIHVAKAPQANLASIKAEIPVTKSLTISMNSGDVIHDYHLIVADKSSDCRSAKSALQCDVPTLALEQGKRYEYELTRSFQDSEQKTVGEGSFTTLKAIAVTKSSVTPDQILYARPKELSFVADKPIAKASVALGVDGTPVEFEQRIEGNTLKLVLSNELPREKAVNLVIKTLEATDGSALIEPYKVPFTTSGGPKIANVSVGSTGTAQSAAIILTFDQPLSKTKDVTGFVAVTGGSASVKKRSDTQLVVQLNALPLCQAFTISIKQGVASEHDIASTKAWNFSSRTICHQMTTYGTSLRGRALNAYIFGSSGPVTMYVGGIHGSEPSSTSLMKAWISELEAHPARFAGKRIVVIPAINPDGLAVGTRTNSRGVNLNRNFPTDNWVKSIKDTDGTHASGGGETPLSEPEASALAKITTSYRPRLLLSFHAVGSLAIGDPGGYSASYASRYASMVGYRDGTNTTSSNFDYNVTGAYEDWTYRNAGIPSIVVELSSYTSVYYGGHYKALWAMLD